MNVQGQPPTAAAQKAEAPKPKKRGPFRRVGCLAVWVLFLTPAIYSLLLVYFPSLEIRLSSPESPHPFQPWLTRGPANSLREWITNVDAGPTMVYLIFAAVLVLLTVAVFVGEEPSTRQ
jgi:hypothetical protein